MTNPKRVPNMPIDWYGASNLLPGLVRADLGLEWFWGGNGKCSGPTGCEPGAGWRDEVATSKILQAQSLPTRETHIGSL